VTRLGDGVAVLLTRLQAVDRADLGAGIGLRIDDDTLAAAALAPVS
jgi:hypothetical protein